MGIKNAYFWGTRAQGILVQATMNPRWRGEICACKYKADLYS